MRHFEFTYPNGIVQQKVLVAHEDYLRWKDLPEVSDEEIAMKNGFWKKKTNGKEWFTDKSPLYEAIETGIIDCNGKYPVIIKELLLLGFNEFLQTHETFQLAVIEAVHRYFFDNCCDEFTGKMKEDSEAKYLFDLLQTLSCETPDWRYRIKKKLERYHGWEKTDALYVGGKPKRIFRIVLNSEQEDERSVAREVDSSTKSLKQKINPLSHDSRRKSKRVN